MITLKEIRTGAAETLRELFPKARVYKNEVIEGFSAPCFFVSAFFNSIRAANKETVFVEATVEIPFFSSKEPLQRVRDEDEAYKVMGMLSAAFASKLKVSDRYLNILGKRYGATVEIVPSEIFPTDSPFLVATSSLTCAALNNTRFTRPMISSPTAVGFTG